MITQEIIEYLSNPDKEVFIEAELHPRRRNSFEKEYQDFTGLSVPTVSNISPYYVWGEETNKWGLELRLYFMSDENILEELENICVNNSRHGYEKYDKRINNNDFIYDLFKNGFILGLQDYSRF